MAQLEASNCREYLFLKFSICGELASIEISDGLPYAHNYVLAEIKKMRDERLIYAYKYSDRKRYYRITNAAGGLSKLKELCGEEALLHFNLMIGCDEAIYSGTKESRLKQRRLYEVCALFVSMGYEIDGIKIKKDSDNFGLRSRAAAGSDENDSCTEVPAKRGFSSDSVFYAEGEMTGLKSVPEIFASRNPNEYSFITCKALRKVSSEGLQLHPRAQMYRVMGILLHRKIIYAVYYFRGSGEIWWKDTEVQFAFQAWRMAAMNLKAFSGVENAGLRKAIIFVPTKDVATDFITNRTKRVKVNPNDVYNLVYVVPLKENVRSIISMLMIDGWKEKLNAVLSVKPSTDEEAEDGWMDSGAGMFNFLCCNVGRMKMMAERIKATNATIVIHDWQVEIAQHLYGKNVSMVVIDAKMFDVLLEAVKQSTLK